MPTVLTAGGYRIVIHLKDHEPNHVHVFKAENEAVINLRPGVSVRNNWGYNTREMTAVLRIAESNLEYLKDEWNTIHND